MYDSHTSEPFHGSAFFSVSRYFCFSLQWIPNMCSACVHAFAWRKILVHVCFSKCRFSRRSCFFICFYSFISVCHWMNEFVHLRNFFRQFFSLSLSLSPVAREFTLRVPLKAVGCLVCLFSYFFVLFIRSFVSETLQWVSVCALAPELLHIENEFSSMLYINDRKSRLAQTNNVWTKKHSLSHTHAECVYKWFLTIWRERWKELHSLVICSKNV